MCARGEGAEIAEKSGCGVVVPPENPERLAEAVLDMASMKEADRRKMGDRGRKFVEGNFNRAEIAEGFRKRLEDVFRNKESRK